MTAKPKYDVTTWDADNKGMVVCGDCWETKPVKLKD